jgi:hypothetical protein
LAIFTKVKKDPHFFLILFLFFGGIPAVHAQRSDSADVKREVHYARNYADSSIRTWGFSGHGGVQVPGGDLLYRYGNNAAAGASMWYKTKSNIVLSFNWDYLFGTKIRENGILDSIETSDGHVIDKEGKYADVRLFERGFTLNVTAGKIFHTSSFLTPNHNSGIYLALGAGMLQHKIRIIDNGSRSPQLQKQYLKGYDRLTSGFALNEFIGYWYMSKNQYVNIYFGLDLTQGFTMSRRSWDYDLMRADTEHRIDLLTGFKLGWAIPFYKRDTNTYHYY